MTLHVLGPEHQDFVKECYKQGGFTDEQAQYEAERVVGFSQAYDSPVYFVGPDANSPKYFFGAAIDDTRRAYLDANVLGIPGPNLYRDAIQWLQYLLVDCQVLLLEAMVWVSDLKKEWLLRAIGFKKAGVMPDKVDIPGEGPKDALLLYIREKDLQNSTPEFFRATLARYRDHVARLEEKRASA